MLQGDEAGLLDDRPFADGVAERDAQLDCVRAGRYQVGNDVQRGAGIGMPDRNEHHQAGAALGLDGGELGGDAVGGGG